MKKNCSCGFILADDRGWLLCHPTNGGNRWDFPKGHVDEGESHMDCALRELCEETGMVLTPSSAIIDLGQHPYVKEKDVHLYYLRVDKLETEDMFCHALVEGAYPEMDAFVVFPPHKILSKLGIKMQAWVKDHVPPELRDGLI